MAYTPKTWVCGETITADGLNNIEEGIQDALDCCEGGGDAGYECEETKTLLTEENVTTSYDTDVNIGYLSYSQLIDADTLFVTFDGVEYTVDKTDFEGTYLYGVISQGSPDFSQYPFLIMSTIQGSIIMTETAGTFLVKIEEYNMSVSVTKCFKRAVEISTNKTFIVNISEDPAIASFESSSETDKSFYDIQSAFLNGQSVFFKYDDTHLWSAILSDDTVMIIVPVGNDNIICRYVRYGSVMEYPFGIE